MESGGLPWDAERRIWKWAHGLALCAVFKLQHTLLSFKVKGQKILSSDQLI